MHALPTFLFASVLGFYFGGPEGLAIGAAGGWVVSLVAAAVSEVYERRRADALAGIIQRLDKVQEAMTAISATCVRSNAIQAAALDAAPIEPYDLLDLRTPHSAEDWEAVYRSKWKLIRRRLVVAYAIRADHVDAAQDYLMDQHAAGYPLPQSDDALAKMVEAWKDAKSGRAT